MNHGSPLFLSIKIHCVKYTATKLLKFMWLLLELKKNDLKNDKND